MRILVTGSSGHLGEALVRKLRDLGHEVAGLDCIASPWTRHVGSIVDVEFVRESLRNIEGVIHGATLHKPHVATHSMQDFIDVNVSGTLNLLEGSVDCGVNAFVFTSTTSVFSGAIAPSGAPARWITEDVPPTPKNVYGITKVAAEDLCRLVHRRTGLPAIVLRTSRFFPEEDDDKAVRTGYTDENVKANEFLYRRVDIEDAVAAHVLALERARSIGFARYVVSATTPFVGEDAAELAVDAPAIVRVRAADYATVYERLGYRMFPVIDRVYVNERARRELGWRPAYDFNHVVRCLREGVDYRSPLARVVGSKGYHTATFTEGPYPVDETNP